MNRFTVHASPDEFERVFAETAEFMARQDGFLQHTLLRHVDDERSYVNIAQWRDEAAFRAAVAAPGFGPHAASLRALSASEPSLYTPAAPTRRSPLAEAGDGPAARS
ncbi:antibiotic biosynthesis monooxygenase family protein [Thermomonospora echinospora]|uniref:antibiotic biosynthesis monooxygenase family protein n=1 Tax=Thermomonospora echinospora TaxID=1992 RepID=UPI001F1ABE93|nr:antibiotic biosynthesis monooxygenase family protein [Thermomonospora echinospora]